MLAAIVVNTTTDDLTPNDGSVSLRKAIQAINAGSDLGDASIKAARTGTYGVNDTIILPAGTYKITIPPSGDDDNTTGDFDISKAVTIQGPGLVPRSSTATASTASSTSSWPPLPSPTPPPSTT